MGSRERIGITKPLQPKAQKLFTDNCGEGFVSEWERQMRADQIDVRTLYSDRYLAQWETPDDAAAPLPNQGFDNAARDPLASLNRW